MAYPSESKKTEGIELSMLPLKSLLKDGTPVVLKRFFRDGSAAAEQTLAAMGELFNFEVATRGDSYPIEEPLPAEGFQSYFTSYETFVLMVDRSEDTRSITLTPGFQKTQKQLTSAAASGQGFKLCDLDLVGCFYVKPNWPGRCSHVCNGGFLVAPMYRDRGAAFIMGESYRHVAKALGYHFSMFNLVFETNLGSNAIWHKLGFTNTGRVPWAGRVRLHKEDDPIMMQTQASQFREKLTLHKAAGSPLTAADREWVNSPLFNTEGIAEAKKGQEAYVSALQWHLDLRQQLDKIQPAWIALTD